MKASEIRNGMEVRISTDLSKTKKTWNLDPDGFMLSMRGRIFKVERITPANAVYVMHGTYSWTFCPEDLHKPKITINDQPPVMFDPKNIC